MIPKAYISEWREHAPWGQDAWVEQDLVLSRAIVEMFRVDDIARRLSFRGNVVPLIRTGLSWDFDAALRLVLGELVRLLPGDPWSGTGQSASGLEP